MIRLAVLLLTAAAASAAPMSLCDERGVELYMEEDYKGAEKEFQAAVERADDDPDCRIWLGRAIGRRAERASGFAKLGAFSLAKQVRRQFAKAVELDPDHLVALQSLFGYYSEAPGIIGGDLDKAEELTSRIEKLDRAEGFRARAVLHVKRDEFDQAEAALRRAIEVDPEDIGHRLSLGSFLARRGRFDESDKIFDALLAKNSDSPQVWFAFGKELALAGRRKPEAKRLLERYLRTPLYEPDAEPYSNARALLKEL